MQKAVSITAWALLIAGCTESYQILSRFGNPSQLAKDSYTIFPLQPFSRQKKTQLYLISISVQM